ncbi:MAG: NADH-quinone oxidoreductase subunit M, partial [Gammaproteobacteria bacterium]
YKRVIFGVVQNERIAKLRDLDHRELVILGSLAGAVLLFGVWPAPMLEIMHATVEHLVEHVSHSKVAMAVTGL